MSYVICTDSACDLSRELLAELGVHYTELTFRFNNDEQEYTNYGMDAKEFYDKMRAGGIAKTAAINTATFIEQFTEILDTGADVLYLGFSSGLSTTYNSARLAAEELSQKYPERKVITVDTLCASAGQGLVVYLAKEKQNAGATVTETAEYVKELLPRLCHWFTVEDLVYLKRGGRVNPAVAFVGNLLGIKPVLHVDDEGHLINVSKARGRKNSLTALADKYGELAVKKDGIAFISQADSMADAEFLASILKEKYGADVRYIQNIGPVIGAHSGPGTIALFFEGKAR